MRRWLKVPGSHDVTCTEPDQPQVRAGVERAECWKCLYFLVTYRST